MSKASTQAAATLESFARQRTVLLTSYRRDGTPIGTPVSIAVDGDRAFVRTYDKSWKARRMRRNPEVEVAPSTTLGRPTGPAIRARARLLGDDEAAGAAKALARKNRILQGLLVPTFHRLRDYRTLHYELTPVDDEPAPSKPERRAESGRGSTRIAVAGN
jgi:PPOX class probable F420-dependent enzyme